MGGGAAATGAFCLGTKGQTPDPEHSPQRDRKVSAIEALTISLMRRLTQLDVSLHQGNVDPPGRGSSVREGPVPSCTWQHHSAVGLSADTSVESGAGAHPKSTAGR